MDQPDFDARELFDEDYLYFYAEALGDERSDAETELLWWLLQLEPGMEVLDLACGHGSSTGSPPSATSTTPATAGS